MHLAQIVEVKGEINLESVQVYPGGMGASMNFPQMGVNIPFGQPPQMGFNMPFGQPPQVSFGAGGFNAGFGFPSAPPVVPTPSFPVRSFFFINKFLYIDN